MHPQLVETSHSGGSNIPLLPSPVIVVIVVVPAATTAGSCSAIVVVVVVVVIIVVVVGIVVHVGVVDWRDGAVKRAHYVDVDVDHGHEIEHQVHQEERNSEKAE